MSFTYDRYDRRRPSRRPQRTPLGYWLPLVLTVTVATAGLAAWIWSERQDADTDDADDVSSSDEQRDGAARARDEKYADPPGYEDTETPHEDEGLVARMSGAIRRTPSPQQVFDSARHRVVAGVAAAGAVVGGALSAIREEDGGRERGDLHGDHERWSEEAERRRQGGEVREAGSGGVGAGGVVRGEGVGMGLGRKEKGREERKRKSVAVVLSAEQGMEALHEEESAYGDEQISLLSHLPPIKHSTTNLFILVFAPHLNSESQPKPISSPASSSSPSLSTPVQTPGEELASMSPQPHEPAMSAKDAEQQGTAYTRLHEQASRLVERRSMVMPFATRTGYVHMLRHLAPDLVYVAEGLAGEEGEAVEMVKGWVGQVVAVVGRGVAGLVDSDEEEGGGRREGMRRWWEDEGRVGLGMGVEVVEEGRLGDDFERRTGGKE